MSKRTTGRTIAFVVSLALLLLTGALGIYNGVTEYAGSNSAFQLSVTAGELLYGVLGLVGAYGLIRRRRWSFATAIAWAVALTYVPGAAVMAYAGEDATIGSALAASGATALIALLVVWTAKVRTRSSGAASPGPQQGAIQ